MHKVTVSDVNATVVYVGILALEVKSITRLQLVKRNTNSDLRLLASRARQLDSILRKYQLHKC
jgi:hypothetical protein